MIKYVKDLDEDLVKYVYSKYSNQQETEDDTETVIKERYFNAYKDLGGKSNKESYLHMWNAFLLMPACNIFPDILRESYENSYTSLDKNTFIWNYVCKQINLLSQSDDNFDPQRVFVSINCITKFTE